MAPSHVPAARGMFTPGGDYSARQRCSAPGIRLGERESVPDASVTAAPLVRQHARRASRSSGVAPAGDRSRTSRSASPYHLRQAAMTAASVASAAALSGAALTSSAPWRLSRPKPREGGSLEQSDERHRVAGCRAGQQQRRGRHADADVLHLGRARSSAAGRGWSDRTGPGSATPAPTGRPRPGTPSDRSRLRTGWSAQPPAPSLRQPGTGRSAACPSAPRPHWAAAPFGVRVRGPVPDRRRVGAFSIRNVPPVSVVFSPVMSSENM